MKTKTSEMASIDLKHQWTSKPPADINSGHYIIGQ